MRVPEEYRKLRPWTCARSSLKTGFVAGSAGGHETGSGRLSVSKA